ncbi:hypothetical protein JCM5296_000436 [Sporobolomyces johnsonii]
MPNPLQPADMDLSAGLDQPSSASSAPLPTTPDTASAPDVASPEDAEESSESDGGNVSEGGTKEPFANLKLDERHFEDSKKRDERKAQLVMGPPLGGSASAAPGQDMVIEGETLAENEEILADLSDDATDLELTHLRLRTLRGLGLERFTKVQRISLRQNLLTALFYHPIPSSSTALSTGQTLADSSASAPRDEEDEDPLDDEDAAKKEADFPYAEHRREEEAETAWPLRNLKELEELDLYDNSLKSVKGLEGLDALTSLDLSFNLLRSVSHFNDSSPSSPYAYPKLTHLYLIQNKLSKIEGVKDRTSLEYLEYGGNRIRTIENLPISANLRSLFLGKNKITKIEGLEGLTGLRTLSIQSNRLTKIEGLDTLTQLEELYLSHNGLTKIEGLTKLTNLTTLDVGHNKIDSVPAEELASLSELEEFWANDNQLAALPSLPPSRHPNLSTIYLEGNPVQKELATAYRRKIMLECPQVKQIDATYSQYPKASYGVNVSFTDYLEAHFPLSTTFEHRRPHIWITLADSLFARTGAANLHQFVNQLNVERRVKYGWRTKETRLVTLCLDEECVEECGRRGMYAYGGFEQHRPRQILKATWPKLASLIEVLPTRDVFFIDSDVSFKQDPYPHMEPFMEDFDLLAQENDVFSHINTGWMWLRKGQVVADAWQEVLEMDMKERSRDQVNFNTVLGTHDLRIHPETPEDPYWRPLPSDFVAKNGLRVHVLDQRLFRTFHFIDRPVYQRQDSFFLHMTCADDSWVKLYVAKTEGFWTDLDGYYSQPPPLVSLEFLSGTRAEIEQLFRLLLAAAHYSGRAVLPPDHATITDLPSAPFVRDAYSTFPLAHIQQALNITMLEPDYVEHASSQLIGQSTLEPAEQREDGWWDTLGWKERERRRDASVALTRVAELDMRQTHSFRELVDRLRSPDFRAAQHVQLMNHDWPDAQQWKKWELPPPVRRVTTCERLEEPYRCNEICRGVDALKQGVVKDEWWDIKPKPI